MAGIISTCKPGLRACNRLLESTVNSPMSRCHSCGTCTSGACILFGFFPCITPLAAKPRSFCSEVIACYRPQRPCMVGVRQRPVFLNNNKKCENHRRQLSVFDKISSTFVAVDWHNPSFMEGNSADEKEIWLTSHMLERTDKELDSAAYLLVIDGWARSGATGAAQKAEKWLVDLERRYRNTLCSENEGTSPNFPVCSSKLEPTIDCYNSVIFAWAKSSESIATIRAERWLSKVKQAMNDVDSTKEDMPTTSARLGPNTNSYNFFLDCLSKGCSKASSDLQSNAEKAEQTLGEMIKLQKVRGDRVNPNTDSFNYVLRAWTRCRNEVSIADKVMDLLREMELCQRSSKNPEHAIIKPNTLSYSLAMDAWVVVAGIKAKQYLNMKKGHVFARGKSASESKGHTFSNGYDEISKAEAILEYMEALQEAGAGVIPDTVSHNIILGGYARISNEVNTDAPFRAERVLRRMKELQISPDQVSYRHVIRCWSNIKRHNSGERGEWWLKQMWQEFNDTGNENTRPDVGVYNAVMSGYADSDAVKVDSLLTEMANIERMDHWIRPNSESYSLAMRSWLKHEKQCSCDAAGEGISNALKRLQELVERERNGVPGSSTSREMFSGILKAGRVVANETTLDAMLVTYEEFKASRHAVGSEACTWLLQTGLRALSAPKYNSKRTKFIRILTRDCCDQGLLSNSYVEALANSPIWIEGWTTEASERITGDLFGNWPLPLSWSRNILKKSLLPQEINVKRTYFRPEND